MIDDAKLTQGKDEFREMLVKANASAESYVVLSIYKNPELYFDSKVKIEDIHDDVWKFYFSLAKKAIDAEKKVLDEIVIGLMVSDNKILQKMYDDNGGYNTISNGITFVKEENYESYLTEIKRTNALIRLHDLGYPIKANFEAYKVLSADEIQKALETALSAIFADIDVQEPVEDLSLGIDAMIEEAHQGAHRGFPLSSALLNEYMNGLSLGNITMLSANSGIGKTFLTVQQVMPNFIKLKEKLLIICNEEDKSKWQQAIVTWVINNVLEGKSFDKQRFFQGNFSTDEMANLKEASAWLKEHMDAGLISFINFNSFSMKKAIKTIKKQNALFGIKYVIIDTLKLDSDAIDGNTQAWLSLMQNMVSLFDVIKKSNKNISTWVTFQLGKSAMLNRYLSQADLGMSRNVVDVVATLILVRKATESEKEGGKNALKVKTKNGLRKLDPEKEYFIVFFGKNRFGPTHRQIVLEVDMARNIVKDFGTTIIEQDN